MRRSMVAFLASWLMLLVVAPATARAATIELVATVPSTQNLSLVYEADTGRLTVDAPAGAPLTAIEVRSSAGRFTKTCEGLGGPFDVCSTSKVFKMDVAGFDRVELGAVLPQNLTVDELKGDLIVDGATAGGGFNQGDGTLLVHRGIAIPEPSSLTLGLLSFLGTWSFVRRR